MNNQELQKVNKMYGIDLEAYEKNWNGKGKTSVGQIVDVYTTFLRPLEKNVLIKYKGKNLIILEKQVSGKEISYNRYEIVFEPISNPKEAAKKKTIQEITELIDHCVFASDAALILYEDGYTKSKVKPLSFNKFVDFMTIPTNIAKYNHLVEKGYCIGSADDELGFL